MTKERRTVFISYSWDGEIHQQWGLNLAKDLMENYGVIVILDQFELRSGGDLPYFMEKSIEQSDKVLIIMTPNYKIKAENRERGVGYEISMISQELYEAPITRNKFIPILREGDSLSSIPKFLKSKKYQSMLEDRKYELDLLELAKAIYDQSDITKPELGPIPNFEEMKVDPILKIADNTSKKDRENRELDQIINSEMGVELFKKEIDKLKNLLHERFNFYETKIPNTFSLDLKDKNNWILFSSNFSVHFNWYIRFNNSLDDAYLHISHKEGSKSNTSLVKHYEMHKSEKLNSFFRFDLDYDKKEVWRLDGNSFFTEKLISEAFLFIIESIAKRKESGFRKY